MYEFNLFDKAIEEDLAMQAAYDEHRNSVESMADLLANTYGWCELYSDFSEEELSEAIDEISRNFEKAQDTLNFNFEEELTRAPLRGTALQFFFDLYGYGSSVDANDILISYLNDVDSDGVQRYRLYAGDSPADIQYFFESILRQPALIFQGTFLPTYTKGQALPTTRSNRQRSLNAICVDIDPMLSSGGLRHPISPDVLIQFLAGCPDDLLPGYISLTGNGIHLWYVFSSPVQVFSRNSVRVRKLRAMARGLYRCVELILEGSESELDFSCCALNHGFRAPGSLSKYQDSVRCFCPDGLAYKRCSVNPATLSQTIAEYLGSEFEQDDVLTGSDVVWKTHKQISEEHEAWLEARRQKPATEAQLDMLHDLEKQDLLRMEETNSLQSMNSQDASELIQRALARRADAKLPSTTSSYSSWRTKPHSLIAGSTGGVYNCILKSITEVKVGRRYNSLHMLAGVAYMMVRPTITKNEVHDDFMNLLTTHWAQAGTPLTERDVNNALKGYNPNNRQTVNSIIDTLGFSPFQPPAKRNGRKQAAHLEKVASDKVRRSREKIMRALEEKPSANMSEVSRMTGLSRPTVKTHWEYCRNALK